MAQVAHFHGLEFDADGVHLPGVHGVEAPDEIVAFAGVFGRGADQFGAVWNYIGNDHVTHVGVGSNVAETASIATPAMSFWSDPNAVSIFMAQRWMVLTRVFVGKTGN